MWWGHEPIRTLQGVDIRCITWWGKNKDFMLIRLFNSIDLIGCGGALTNQNLERGARKAHKVCKAHKVHKACKAHKVVGKKSGFYVN